MALTDKLTAIGDAIRAKTGETALLKLDDMPTAIAGIQTGGSGDDLFVGYLNNTLTEFRVPDGVSSLPNEFYKDTKVLTKVDLNEVTTLNAGNFQNCSALTECDTSKVQYIKGGNVFSGTQLSFIDLASIQNLGTQITSYDRTFQNCNFEEVRNFKPTKLHSYIFNGCAKLKTIDLSELLETSNSCFYGCKAIGDIILPKIQKIGSSLFSLSYYYDAPHRTKIDISADCTSIGAEAFKNNAYVTTIIVRAITPPTLANANAFFGIFNNVNEKVASLERHIYVPAESYTAYMNATNWSTYVGNGTVFRKIEDYPEITGG